MICIMLKTWAVVGTDYVGPFLSKNVGGPEGVVQVGQAVPDLLPDHHVAGNGPVLEGGVCKLGLQRDGDSWESMVEHLGISFSFVDVMAMVSLVTVSG